MKDIKHSAEEDGLDLVHEVWDFTQQYMKVVY